MRRHLSLITAVIFAISAGLISLPAHAGDKDAAPGELELYPRDASDPCIPGSLQVRVNVIGVTQVGILKLELYNTDEGFLGKKARLRKVRVPAQDGPQLVCMDLPEPGPYAVAGYHDKDGNRKLKKKWDFTPREPYGLSNNPDIRSRRMPKFEEAAIEIGKQGADIDFILVDLKAKKKQRDSKD